MEQKLTILHFSGAAGWRGGEQQLSYLMEELLPFTCQYLLSPIGAPIETISQKLKLPSSSYKKRTGIALSAAIRLKDELRKKPVDIIHLHDPYAHMAFVLAAALFDVKTPAVLHRRVDFKTGHLFLSKWKYNYPNIRKIICVSGAIYKVLLPIINDKERLTVIHSGIDCERFRYTDITDQNLKITYRLPDNAVLIGNVAALEKHKDHFTFLRTAQQLCKSNSSLFFFIAGSGSLEQKLESYANELGISDRVFFTGFKENIAAFLHQLDLFLYTSEEEGLGTAILEAMAAGVPVIATNAGGIPEIIQHNINGLLCNCGDDVSLALSCSSVLKDPNLKNQLITEGLKTANSFSKAKMSAEILNLYSTILHAQ